MRYQRHNDYQGRYTGPAVDYQPSLELDVEPLGFSGLELSLQDDDAPQRGKGKGQGRGRNKAGKKGGKKDQKRKQDPDCPNPGQGPGKGKGQGKGKNPDN